MVRASSGKNKGKASSSKKRSGSSKKRGGVSKKGGSSSKARRSRMDLSDNEYVDVVEINYVEPRVSGLGRLNFSQEIGGGVSTASSELVDSALSKLGLNLASYDPFTELVKRQLKGLQYAWLQDPGQYYAQQLNESIVTMALGISKLSDAVGIVDAPITKSEWNDRMRLAAGLADRISSSVKRLPDLAAGDPCTAVGESIGRIQLMLSNSALISRYLSGKSDADVRIPSELVAIKKDMDELLLSGTSERLNPKSNLAIIERSWGLVNEVYKMIGALRDQVTYWTRLYNAYIQKAAAELARDSDQYTYTDVGAALVNAAQRVARTINDYVVGSGKLQYLNALVMYAATVPQLEVRSIDSNDPLNIIAIDPSKMCDITKHSSTVDLAAITAAYNA